MIQLIIQSFFIGLFYFLAFFVLYIVLSTTWLDLSRVQSIKKISQLPKNLKHRPVTIVIYTLNNQAEILDTLNSLKKLKYRNLKVVVVDNNSTDNTSKIIKKFSTTYPKLNMHFVAKRKTSSYNQTLKQVIQYIKDESLILKLNPGRSVDDEVIKRINAQFSINKSSSNMWLRIVPVVTYSYIQIADCLTRLTKNKIKESLRLLGLESNSLYSDFACTIVHFKKITVKESKEPNQYINHVIQVLLLLAATYYVYVAVTFYNNGLLVYGTALIFIWLFYIIISAKPLNFKDKFILISTVPILYLLIATTYIFEHLNLLKAPQPTLLTD